MDVENIWSAWPVSGPWQVAPLAGGTNNRVLRVDAADGERYVLRVLTDEGRVPQLRYEADVLRALAEKELPFRVAAPMRAHSGDIFVFFEQEDGRRAFASLVPFLSGRIPERNDRAFVAHAGEMLGVLDEALAMLDEVKLVDGYKHTMYGELENIHPLVSDPIGMIERLPIEREKGRLIRRFLGEVMESVAGLYGTLPMQIVHGDYAASNMLMEDGRIAAILDFEFVGRDLRVLDLSVALSWWPVDVMGTGKEWEIVDTFGRAYMRRV